MDGHGKYQRDTIEFCLIPDRIMCILRVVTLHMDLLSC